jgi:hypothetical protein
MGGKKNRIVQVAWDAVPEPMVEYIDPDFILDNLAVQDCPSAILKYVKHNKNYKNSGNKKTDSTNKRIVQQSLTIIILALVMT